MDLVAFVGRSFKHILDSGLGPTAELQQRPGLSK